MHVHDFSAYLVFETNKDDIWIQVTIWIEMKAMKVPPKMISKIAPGKEFPKIIYMPCFILSEPEFENSLNWANKLYVKL